jgi:hypothetical protein
MKSWWQWRNVHHTTQHLTFTMSCYSLCTLNVVISTHTHFIFVMLQAIQLHLLYSLAA